MPTKIEWCDEVWNIVTGCTKISPGCKNCYAERVTKRFTPKKDFSFVDMHSNRMVYPLRWKKPRSVFLCSMGDLFHESVNFLFIDAVFNMTQEVDRHTYLVLTKRPERVLEYFRSFEHRDFDLSNVWFGVSVENQETADERISILLQIPAARRFVSIEPMLEQIDISFPVTVSAGAYGIKEEVPAIISLDWVIAGCESGPKRRPAKIDWFRSLRDQCVTAKVPFFLKQTNGYINGKSAVVKMPMLDLITWNQKPKEKKA